MPIFRIENDEVIMYSADGGRITSFGPIRHVDDDAIARAIAHAFQAGRRAKAREVREFMLGNRD